MGEGDVRGGMYGLEETHSADWQLLKLGGGDAGKECRDSDSDGLHGGGGLSLNMHLLRWTRGRCLVVEKVCEVSWGSRSI